MSEDSQKKGRQHTVSLPPDLWEPIDAEADHVSLNIGELARCILRAWRDGKTMPVRNLASAKAIAPLVIAEIIPAPPVASAGASTKAPEVPVQTKAHTQLDKGRPSSTRAPAVYRAPEAPPTPLIQPDPDFDSAEALMEARELMGGVGDGVPF